MGPETPVEQMFQNVFGAKIRLGMQECPDLALTNIAWQLYLCG